MFPQKLIAALNMYGISIDNNVDIDSYIQLCYAIPFKKDCSDKCNGMYNLFLELIFSRIPFL